MFKSRAVFDNLCYYVKSRVVVNIRVEDQGCVETTRTFVNDQSCDVYPVLKSRVEVGYLY